MEKSMTNGRFSKVAATMAAAFLMMALAGCGQQPSSDVGDARDITVSLIVDGTMGDKGIIFDEEINLDEGMTAYDALLASGLELELDQSSSAPYVTGIGGLTNADGTMNSGWLLTLNGEMPLEGASDLVLRDGDVIIWTWWLDATEAFSDSVADTAA